MTLLIVRSNFFLNFVLIFLLSVHSSHIYDTILDDIACEDCDLHTKDEAQGNSGPFLANIRGGSIGGNHYSFSSAPSADTQASCNWKPADHHYFDTLDHVQYNSELVWSDHTDFDMESVAQLGQSGQNDIRPSDTPSRGYFNLHQAPSSGMVAEGQVAEDIQECEKSITENPRDGMSTDQINDWDDEDFQKLFNDESMVPTDFDFLRSSDTYDVDLRGRSLDRLKEAIVKTRIEEVIRRQASWKRSLGQNLRKVCQNYARVTSCGLTKAMLHLNYVAEEGLAWQLLNKDAKVRQDAAMSIYRKASEHFHLRQPCASKEVLGINQIEAIRAFRSATGKSYSTAWRHFNNAMTPEIAQRIAAPDTFNQGIQTLIRLYKEKQHKRYRKVEDWRVKGIEKEGEEVTEVKQGEDNTLSSNARSYLAKTSSQPSANLVNDDDVNTVCRPPSDWKEMLGAYASEVGKVFRAATGKGYVTSSRFLSRSVTPEIAAKINDPETHDEALFQLIAPYICKPPRTGKVRGKGKVRNDNK